MSNWLRKKISRFKNPAFRCRIFGFWGDEGVEGFTLALEWLGHYRSLFMKSTYTYVYIAILNVAWMFTIAAAMASGHAYTLANVYNSYFTQS